MPAKRSLTAAIVLLLVAAIPVRGATPPTIQQIDLRPMANGSGPGDLVPFAGKIFFVANDGTHGRELWRTDGAADATHDGTELACDLFTLPGYGSEPRNLIVLGDRLYFLADAGVARFALFRTDGSIDGCELVDPSVTADVAFDGARAIGDQLWFAGLNADGKEPWVTTNAGVPVRVFNVNPTGDSNPSGFTKLGSYVYFSANDGVHGRELWRSDGVTTTMVTDIYSGATGSDPRNLTAVGNQLFFTVDTETQGTELAWLNLDGYQGVMDIVAGAGGSYPENFVNYNGQLYFTATTPELGQELWHFNSVELILMFDGEINAGPSSSGIFDLRPTSSGLYFQADDGTHGIELWRLNDGMLGMVKDIVPGSGSSYPYGMTEHEGVIYFQALNGSSYTIFKTSGTSESTSEAVTLTGTTPYAGCECNSPTVFFGDRIFTYLGNTEYGYEVAFFDPLLPSTNREDFVLTTALIIASALTAAAGLTVRTRASK